MDKGNILLQRTSSTDTDFIELCMQLDNELRMRYGKAQSDYDSNNIIEHCDTVIVGYLDDVPTACGCFKEIGAETIEMKRMYVSPPLRRKGLSSTILSALELWGGELGYASAILETGKGQPEAIALYQKAGYVVTPNYGPYIGVANSICMKKDIGLK